MLIEITIKGQTPLICNKFTDAAQMSATSGTRSKVTTQKLPRRVRETYPKRRAIRDSGGWHP